MAAATLGKVSAGNQFPTSFTTTHDTDGLPGWGALDWFRPAGTVIGTPVGGTIERTGGTSGARGAKIYGRNIYLRTDSGQRLFLTHFSEIFVRDRQRVEPGEPLGRVAPYGNASHIHVAAQGAADKGGKVSLTGGGGSSAPSGKGKDVFPGRGEGVVSGAVDSVLNAPDKWVGDQIKGLWKGIDLARIAQVGGGFVLLLVGLVLLGRHLGLPSPDRVPLPGSRDLYQSG